MSTEVRFMTVFGAADFCCVPLTDITAAMAVLGAVRDRMFYDEIAPNRPAFFPILQAME